jgi:hypothetical protein
MIKVKYLNILNIPCFRFLFFNLLKKLTFVWVIKLIGKCLQLDLTLFKDTRKRSDMFLRSEKKKLKSAREKIKRKEKII